MEFGPVIKLASLDGANGFRLDGPAAYDRSGASAASAGDINGDGFDDVIVGADGADPNGKGRAGSSYVVFGSANGFAAGLDLDRLDGANGFRLDGASAYDYSGVSVASAGDVNGDGFDDIVIGAEGADPNGIHDAGSSYVVFGSGEGFAARVNLGALNGRNGFRLDGAGDADNTGRSVASAGDVNGDGFDDVIVGAFLANPNGEIAAGSSYVVFGSGRRFSDSIDLDALDGRDGFRLDGATMLDFSGRPVASAGDVNGDGLDDIVIGADEADPNGRSEAGASYVVFGSRGFDATLDLGSLDGRNGFRIAGVSADDNSGRSVASAGDVNGDGFDDVIVGALGADPNGNDYAGSSYVVFGSERGFPANLNLRALDGTNGFRLDGIADDDYAGRSVASAGDVNGDGFDDVIIGAVGADPDGVSRAGSSYVVFGSGRGFAPSLDLSTLDGSDGFRLDGVAAADNAGSSVASAGDVNGDGFGDLVLGVEGADADGADAAGSTYVLFGREPDTAVTRVGSAAGQVIQGGAFGDLLSGLAGEDVLVGARGSDSLKGGTGADTLKGDRGDDVLLGQDGDDRLLGGAGLDRLRGGAGEDAFVFRSVAEAPPGGLSDVIEDFRPGTDLIDLASIDADGRAGDGDDAFAFIGTAAFSGSAGELRYRIVAGVTNVHADIDGDGTADLRVRLDGGPALTASDFVL